MSFFTFLKTRVSFILINLLYIGVICFYLLIFDIPRMAVILIVLCWLLVFLLYFFLSYRKRVAYFRETEAFLRERGDRYTFKIVEEPPFFEAMPYYALARELEETMQRELEWRDKHSAAYQQYIETWVHEVKMPIAALRLITESDLQDRPDTAADLGEELEKLENSVDQALYVARMEHVEKDYLIREVPLMRPVKQVIERNRALFQRKRVSVEVANNGLTVYSDEKWLGFLINQIVQNSVKYGAKHIQIFGKEEWSGVSLYVRDDGRGIPVADLDRVFDKGFTGQTGRTDEHSTGLGLYLVKELCKHLEHDVSIESLEGEYTKVRLYFPKNRFVVRDVHDLQF